MSLPRYAFFQGRVVPYSEARVGVLTHGLNYGTGVFSGIRGYWNADEHELFVFRPDDHYRRFLESARMIGMQLPLDSGQREAMVTCRPDFPSCAARSRRGWRPAVSRRVTIRS